MAEQPPATLSRELNLFHLTMMGVGMMIGAGAVIGMGQSVAIAGPGGTLVAFALDGLHVRRAGRREPDLQRSIASVCARTGFPKDRVAARVLTASDPRAEILREAAGADLLVLGASRSGRWARALRLSLPEEIALETEKPFIIVRARRRAVPLQGGRVRQKGSR